MAPLERLPLVVPADDRHIRVRLLHDVSEVALAVDGPFRLEDRAGRVLSDSVSGLNSATVTVKVNPVGQFRIGRAAYPTDELYVVPIYNGGVTVDGRRYRGYLRLYRTGRTMTITNVLDIEDYLRGVLAGEMPGNFHLEAFKAQAIAARTYALVQKQRFGRSRSWEVWPDERSQMYIGMAGETDKTLRAVEQTRDLVLTWDSPDGPEMFAAYYSSTCGGYTTDAVNANLEHESIPPLAGGVECPYCGHSKYRMWPTVKLSYGELTRLLTERQPKLKRLGRIRAVHAAETDPHGWVITLELRGSTGKTAQIGAYEFRGIIGSRRLRSTNFQVVNERDGVSFANGRGFGHGVGMCQYGADGMAKRGRTAEQILRFYYPGAAITRLPSPGEPRFARR